ncbi:putative tRNA/rRNA methyltransferase, SpoU type, tRNA (guanine-N1-)-methyltransferase [Plasmopara halstedii]
MEVIDATWARWLRFHQRHCTTREIDVATARTQFELVAIGLTLSFNEVQMLFSNDAQALTTMFTPFPKPQDDVESTCHYHFRLVVSATLLDDYLQFVEALEAQTMRLLVSNWTMNVLLPALRLERLAYLHPTVLRILQTLLKTYKDQKEIKQVITMILQLLSDPGDEEVSYDALCRLLRLLQQQTYNSVDILQICAMAIKEWRLRPRFLRSAVLHLVPMLLEDKVEGEMHQRLLELVLDAWDPHQTMEDPRELLYLVCTIISKAPRELMSDARLQQLVCFALRHNDVLLRKQGLHILKVAFSLCVMDLESDRLENARDTEVTWVDLWRKFLTASEVIQMHHEQHLIEQVWTQVADLLSTNLVVYENENINEQQDKNQWPVELTFDWVQGLLLRLFNHDNPFVKRSFLSNFTEICINSFQLCGKQHFTSNDVDNNASFACSPTFRSFVLNDMLRACNDPVLYKNAHRARFQTSVTHFLASFLSFELTNRVNEYLLDDFVAAVDVAIFGKDETSHSPEALLSMLQVFQSPHLKQAASLASPKILLSDSAVNQLRVLLDIHAMQSFSQVMRSKMLCALTHALTGGFVDATAISLSTLARVLCIYPNSILVTEGGETLGRYLSWIKSSTSIEGWTKFLNSLSSALQRNLTPHVSQSAESELSSTQLARLLLLTADNISEPESQYIEALPGHQIQVVLRAPLSALLSEISHKDIDSTRLVLLIAKLEHQIQDLTLVCSSSPSHGLTFAFERENFYGGEISCSYLFESSMQIARNCLDSILSKNKMQSSEEKFSEIMDLAHSAGLVLTQMSAHQLYLTGSMHEMSRLDALCDEFKVLLASSADRNVLDLALAAEYLSTVGTNAIAVDSLHAFETPHLLSILLALDTSRRYGGKLDARCSIRLATSKWALLYQVVQSSSFIDTKLLQATFDACVKALPTAGMDVSTLLQMVNVLSLTLSQLAGTLVNMDEGSDTVNNLLEEVWTAYIDSKAKPDALTRAVIVCMLQPVFLFRKELTSMMKHWIAEFIRFGSRHRPNVIFHLTCRLCQTWRTHPMLALAFADELVELLLYKEPLIDEKEQLSRDTNVPFQGFQGFSPSCEGQEAAITTHAKDQFVRLVVLSFLDDISVDRSLFGEDTQALMDALFVRLVQLNVTPDWQKQHMLNSDGFGKKLRSWQALCIVSAHVTKSQLTTLFSTLQIAFGVPQLPSVRYYMELFGMRIATRMPREVCSGILLPMLSDANLMPQVGASMLLVSAHLVNAQLDKESVDFNCGILLETLLPWLNSSHGYTRVVAQYLLSKLLPRYIHQLQVRYPNSPGLRYLEGTARYLSTNKECKRLLRRQARQFEEFYPDYESSLLGMLSCGFISEFGELLPRDEALRFCDQLKKAMNELYSQYQLENFPLTPSLQKSSGGFCSKGDGSAGTLIVQRKIDTTALLLEDSALPVAMRIDYDATRYNHSLNARQQPRQPIIMCASLVDKIPNLAGLARTCEIFNAEKLIVPNLRLAQQDVTFANVSATAHKWMPLEEVRPQGDDLHQIILRWKQEGYTIVALEQTASSVSLANYTLPRKMVLILGREKEGIPLELLQLVDVCVEIPQFGLVRSLNVHVSGALVLWEYTKQQLTSGAIESTL